MLFDDGQSVSLNKNLYLAKTLSFEEVAEGKILEGQIIGNG